MEGDWVKITEGVVSQDGLVGLNCHGQDKALYGVLNKVPLLFEVKTGEKPKKKSESRPNFNLAIVLDRSGSMEGPPFENAKVAVKKVIENLKEGDVIHFVVYDTRVDTIFQNETVKSKRQLLAMVDEIATRDCTNLCGGLQRAFDVLKDSNTVLNKRIFLFSDGMVNEGITNHEKIFDVVKGFHKHGVNVTTFGIGSDFDEKLMKGIAEHGRGDYFFIEGADDIVNKVEKGMKVLFELLCRNAVLTLRGLNGAILTKIFAQPEESLIKGAQVGDISEDDLRQVIAEIEIRPDASKGSEDVLEYSLTYERTEDHSQQTLSGKFNISYTHEASQVHEPSSVKVALKIAESSENDRVVIQLVRDGEFEEAVQKKSAMISQLKELEGEDTTGLIPLIVARAEKTLAGMKEQENVAQMEKDIGYDEHLTSIVHRKCF